MANDPSSDTPNYNLPWIEAARSIAESMRPMALWANEHQTEFAQMAATIRNAQASIGTVISTMTEQFSKSMAQMAPSSPPYS